MQELIGAERSAELLRSGAQSEADGAVTTEDFVILAKTQNPGVDLDVVFDS